jgi:hypothetical protein
MTWIMCYSHKMNHIKFIACKFAESSYLKYYRKVIFLIFIINLICTYLEQNSIIIKFIDII